MAKMVTNVLPAALSSVVMGLLAYLLGQVNNSIVWDVISIILCSSLYLTIILLFPNIRAEVEIISLVKRILPRKTKIMLLKVLGRLAN